MTSDKKSNTQINRGLLGAGLAALAASICCVGPLVLLGLGLGGAWVGNLTVLEPFRPYLMALTLAFLGYAFYRIYRKPLAEDCAPGTYCANPKAHRRNKITLWTVTVFILGLLALPYLTPVIFAEKGNEVAVNTNFREVVLDVPGMTCASCPVTIQKSLKRVDGVIAASASFESKTATVRYDPTKISTRDLLNATRNAGYESTVH